MKHPVNEVGVPHCCRIFQGGSNESDTPEGSSGDSGEGSKALIQLSCPGR